MDIRPGLIAASACLVLAACGGSGGQPGSAPAAVNASAQPAPAGGTPAKLDIDAIFPRGEGRDLVLNNCTSCHTIVPIVVLQMTKDAWDLNAREHRDRVTSLSDADFATLYTYLVANFNPDRPVPQLPKELLDTWTSY